MSDNFVPNRFDQGGSGLRSNDNTATIFSRDRIARDREEEQMRPKPTPTDARTAAYLQARDYEAKAATIQKLKADGIALQNGTLRILDDGTRLRKYGTRWELSQ
jgi:hypothetical protein